MTWDKQYTLFFAGGVRYDDVSYSHGVRQTLMMLFSRHPGRHPRIIAVIKGKFFTFPFGSTNGAFIFNYRCGVRKAARYCMWKEVLHAELLARLQVD